MTAAVCACDSHAPRNISVDSDLMSVAGFRRSKAFPMIHDFGLGDSCDEGNGIPFG